MIADLFWNVVTSYAVLGLVAAILVAAFVVSHTPAILTRFWPQAYVYAKAAGLVQIIAAALLFFLVGFRVADERAETKQLKNDLAFKELQIETAEGTAKDAERLKDEAKAKAAEAKGQLDEFRKRFGDNPETACAFTADDLERLRQLRGTQHR